MELVEKVEKAVERIMSKLVGAELSAAELEQVSGGSRECAVIFSGPKDGCDE